MCFLIISDETNDVGKIESRDCIRPYPLRVRSTHRHSARLTKIYPPLHTLKAGRESETEYQWKGIVVEMVIKTLQLYCDMTYCGMKCLKM